MIYDQVNLAKMRETLAPVRLFEKTIHFGVTNAAADDVFPVIPLIAGDVVIAAWVNVITACTADATIDLGYGSDIDYYGNALQVDAVGHCRTMLNGSLAWNVMEIPHGIEETNEVQIPGARFGDHVTISSGMDLADMSLSGEVLRDDIVTVRLTNNTGGTLDLLHSQTLDVAVNKAPQMASPFVVPAGDTIDVTANTAITSGKITVSALIIRK